MQERRSPVPAPRGHARSGLAWAAGIAGALLVAGGVAHRVAGHRNSPMLHAAVGPIAVTVESTPRHGAYGENDLGIPYGTAASHVLRELGPPTAKQGSCWIYRGRIGRIRGRSSDSFVDAMKFCLSEGPAGGMAVTQVFDHYVAHIIVRTDPVTHRVEKRTYPALWGHPVVLMKVPDWYVQESS
jgi:hypothetical protein